MRKIIYLILFSCISTISAQISLDQELNSSLYLFNEKQEFMNNNEIIDLSQAIGSPYLNPIFVSGNILNTITGDFMGYQMRYNVYNDRIEVLNFNEKAIYSVQKNHIFRCKIGEDTFIYLLDKNTQKDSYYQVLTEGKVSLLKKYTAKYSPKKIGKPPVFKEIPVKFVINYSYYILINENIISIPTNRKKFYQVFGKFDNQIKSFIKSRGLKINKERDLIRIISFYNTLI